MSLSNAIVECGDYSEFQDALKVMRKTDDLIISTLNTTIPTDSFHPDGSKACKDLQNQLDEVKEKRENIIKKCITITADRVKKLKEQKASDLNDIQLTKNLRAEQTKLRMLQVELSVEELVRARTSKVFLERCRKYL